MSVDLVSHVASTSIRSIVLGLATFVCLWIFRVRSPAARHAAWTVVLIGMLLQVFLEPAAPTVPLRLLPPAPASSAVQTRVRMSGPAARTLTPAGEMGAETKRRRISGSEVLAYIYLGTFVLLFGQMALGYWRLRKILRDAS
jgi:hypothetical protein